MGASAWPNMKEKRCEPQQVVTLKNRLCGGRRSSGEPRRCGTNHISGGDLLRGGRSVFLRLVGITVPPYKKFNKSFKAPCHINN